MGTAAVESEKVLAEQACHRVRGKSACVLIGGLGFGFTLKRVLELVGPEAQIHVVELLPEVVAWNREYLGKVNGRLLDNARVQVFVEDVFQVLARATPGQYDAIILDVDNGPIAMVRDANARLYKDTGFDLITKALKEKGRVVFWSASDDKPFAKRLAKAGFRVTVVPAKSHERARRFDHVIFVGDREVAGARR